MEGPFLQRCYGGRWDARYAEWKECRNRCVWEHILLAGILHTITLIITGSDINVGMGTGTGNMGMGTGAGNNMGMGTELVMCMCVCLCMPSCSDCFAEEHFK